MIRSSWTLVLAALALAAPLRLAGPSGDALGGLTPEQLEILGHLHLVQLDDGQGNTLKTIEIRGVNVRIVNGLGATNGVPRAPHDPAQAVTNGLGNLIIGYAEGDGQRLRRWNLVDAFPVKWTGPTFAASGSESLSEELEIAHHGFTSGS